MKRVHYFSDSTDVYFNLALEEYCIRNFDFSNQELLLIYRNEPCIVLGKNQNFFQEVHLSSFFKSNYNLARRISGGGTVVHDLGNINFAFFEKHDLKKVNRYSSSVGRITQILNELNIESSMNERNAIILGNGKKISGSAQFSSNKAILSHLTLLYNSNLELIDQLIQKNPYSLETKASQSVRSMIDNVSNHLDLTQDEFIQKTIALLGFEKMLDLDTKAKSEVQKLMEQKYCQSSFYLETAANGRIVYSDLELELNKGRISKIQGITNVYQYLDKLLFPSELSLEDPIWKLLFH